MGISIYPKGDGYIVGNTMDDVRNVSFKENSHKFHENSIYHAIKDLLVS